MSAPDPIVDDARSNASALAAERRRAPDREARSASHLERMESAAKNVLDPTDTDDSRERGT